MGDVSVSVRVSRGDYGTAITPEFKVQRLADQRPTARPGAGLGDDCPGDQLRAELRHKVKITTGGYTDAT